jgi:hypothetical protein
LENAVRFVGQTEIASFLLEWPEYAEPLQAWLTEMKHRRWPSADALAVDFPNVDASRAPVLVFYLLPAGIRIETLVDFRNGIVLLTVIQAGQRRVPP